MLSYQSCLTLFGVLTPIIWIEHIVHALVSVVSRLMCIAGGQVIAVGDSQSVLNNAKVVELYLGNDFSEGQAR